MLLRLDRLWSLITDVTMAYMLHGIGDRLFMLLRLDRLWSLITDVTMAYMLHGIAGHYLGVKMVWVEQDPKSQAATLKATEASGLSVSTSPIVSQQHPSLSWCPLKISSF
jgi:hypothetical protein